MTRARFSFAAMLAIAVFCAGDLFAQAAPAGQAPPMQSVLAGKKLTPPARGEVTIEHTAPATKRVGDLVVTTFQVKAVGLEPVARLTITETWFDKKGTTVSGGKGFINGLLQPGEVQTIKIETPYKEAMDRNTYVFSHANGSVKVKAVAKFDAPKPATTTTTTSAPKATTTSKK